MQIFLFSYQEVAIEYNPLNIKLISKDLLEPKLFKVTFQSTPKDLSVTIDEVIKKQIEKIEMDRQEPSRYFFAVLKQRGALLVLHDTEAHLTPRPINKFRKKLQGLYYYRGEIEDVLSFIEQLIVFEKLPFLLTPDKLKISKLSRI